MGSQFMNQFMQGWQMGQGRNENQRRNQELEMERARQEQMLRQRAEEFELQKEEFAVRRKQLAAQEAAHKLSAAQEARKLREEASYLQGMPAPTAAEAGIQQTTPQDVGPTMDQINVPQPTQAMPDPSGGADIQMPVLTGRQQQEMAQAEQQRKIQQALGLKVAEQKALEPFKVADDERTAKLWRERDAAAERRSAAAEVARRARGRGDASKLRKEYNDQLKTYLPQIDTFNRAQALAAKPDDARTPADDIALVFTFMKTMDPNSTVREGEYATAKNAAGVPERLRNSYNATVKGTFLSPEQRKSFSDAIERDFRSGAGKRIGLIQQRYNMLAEEAGINPSLVLMEDGFGSGGGGGDGTAPKATHRWSPRGGITPIGGK